MWTFYLHLKMQNYKTHLSSHSSLWCWHLFLQCTHQASARTISSLSHSPHISKPSHLFFTKKWPHFSVHRENRRPRQKCPHFMVPNIETYFPPHLIRWWSFSSYQRLIPLLGNLYLSFFHKADPKYVPYLSEFKSCKVFPTCY